MMTELNLPSPIEQLSIEGGDAAELGVLTQRMAQNHSFQ